MAVGGSARSFRGWSYFEEPLQACQRPLRMGSQIERQAWFVSLATADLPPPPFLFLFARVGSCLTPWIISMGTCIRPMASLAL